MIKNRPIQHSSTKGRPHLRLHDLALPRIGFDRAYCGNRLNFVRASFNDSPSQTPSPQPSISFPTTSDITIHARFVDWIHNTRIRYRCAGPGTESPSTSPSPPPPQLLLIPGFGVSSLQYSVNLPALARAGIRTYALDLLGQGESWPRPEATALDKAQIQYSVDTWLQQLTFFIEHVMEEAGNDGDRRIFVAGNSLGGFLATHLAAQRPDLVRGLVLLNATPFWAFQPHPSTRPGWLSTLYDKFNIYQGRGPAPSWLKGMIQSLWWDTLRRPSNVRAILSLVYADRTRFSSTTATSSTTESLESTSGQEDVSHYTSLTRPLLDDALLSDDALIESILAPTRHPDGLDAFCSIVMSPKPSVSFDQALATLRNARGTSHACSIRLVYGKNDPWVVPLWGQRARRALPHAVYYEVSPSGHCPAHETPGAVNALVAHFVQTQMKTNEDEDDLTFGGMRVNESVDIGTVQVRLTNGEPTNWWEAFVSSIDRRAE